MPGFEDRTVTLEGTPDQLAALGALVGSRTRLAVLWELVRSDEPLNIHELARRVKVDASPVRTHLELLLREELVEEVPAAGRERKFTTRLRNVRLILEGVRRERPLRKGDPPKAVWKLRKKLADLERDRAKLEEKARRLQAELDTVWGETLAMDAKP